MKGSKNSARFFISPEVTNLKNITTKQWIMLDNLELLETFFSVNVEEIVYRQKD